MIAELSSLVSSTKTAYEIAKGIRSLKAEVERSEAISKILEVLISIQAHALSAQAKIQELEIEKYELSKKILEFDKWAEIEKKYELKEVAPGTFVYLFNASQNNETPVHWLCPKCFQERKTYIIQLQRESAAGKHYFCPNCSTKFDIRDSTTRSSSPNGGRGGPNSWMGA